MKMGVFLIFATLGIFSAPRNARAFDLFRRENRHVARGNEKLAANDPAGALEQYDLAARELPSEPRVHLNRGIALLAQKTFDKAREAFLLAAEPPAPADVRAAANYNLGLAFYEEGDAKSTETDHKEAQRLFREAADAFRKSLRAVPGNRDAGWNLELALRRIRNEEEQQKQEEEKKKQDEQQKKDEQQQNQDQNQDQNQKQDGQDGQNSSENKPDSNQPDGGTQDQQNAQNQQQPQNQDQQNQQQQGQNGQQPKPDDQGQQNAEAQGANDSQQHGEQIPADVARVLDSLQNGEDNLERQRARMRAMRENRAPTKDW